MRTFKTILALFACGIMLFGCGQTKLSQEPAISQDSEEKTDNTEKPEEKPEQTPVVSEVKPLKSFSPVITEEIESIHLSETEIAYNKGANHFALGLIPALYEDASFVASPLSLQVALSMAAAGASGETLQEMQALLGFPQAGVENMNLYTKILLEQLPAIDLSVQLQMADALIVNKDFPLQEKYQLDMGSYYYAPVQNMDFTQAEKVIKVVNDWCYENTHGLIPYLLDEKEFNLTAAYLLNVLYFKADWTTQFSSYQVFKNGVFHSTRGDINVDYLCTQTYLDYSDFGSYRMALLPLGTKSLFNIAILLPKDNNGLKALLNELNQMSWLELLSQTERREVLFRLPKFEISSSYELKSILEEQGMTRAFTANAQFDNMFDYGVTGYIYDVIQKSRIVLDEGGIEAAAVTDVEMGATDTGEDIPTPTEFYADHPFVYVITEKSTGTILFVGAFQG